MHNVKWNFDRPSNESRYPPTFYPREKYRHVGLRTTTKVSQLPERGARLLQLYGVHSCIAALVRYSVCAH